MEQFWNADALPGHRGHHRDPEFPTQPGHVDSDAMSFGLVHQVEAHDHFVGDLEDLQNQVEVSFESGRVHYHDSHVGSAEQDEIAGHFFIRAASLQRVSARQIDYLDPFAREIETALCPCYGLARPVAGMLPQACKGIEYCALSCVGIACQGDQVVPAIQPDSQFDQAGLTAQATPGARIGPHGVAHTEPI